jgi:trehalose-phosphatase
VSGRWTRDLIPLLGIEKPPEIWGCHGWERLRPGRSPELGPVWEEAVRGLVRADEWARAERLGARCERKPASVALHWRGLAPGAREELRARALPVWTEIARGSSLELRDFDGGVELRSPGRDKGSAVRTVLSEEPPGASVAYLGDDLTDEDAFRALEGRGLRVLVHAEGRPTEADIRIRPPEELLAFLDRWTLAAGG